jgi:phosphatidylinositol alpha-1,6-mannosyltransferase
MVEARISSRRARVLWITANFPPEIGGLQVYAERLTDGLAAYCQVGLVTAAHHARPHDRAIVHFPVASITVPGGPAGWQEANDEVAAVIAEFGPDIVHFASANEAIFRPVIGRSLPVVASVHGNDLTAPWQRTPGRNPLRCILEGLNACDRIIAVSYHTAGLVRRWGAKAPTTVLRSGCDLDFFQPAPPSGDATRLRYRLPAGLPILLTVARLVPRKGHLVIAEAIARLTSPVSWLVVGDGPIRASLEDAVARAGTTDRVRLTGEVSREELRSIYQSCDLFVLTPEERRIGDRYDSEGFGLVFLEAGACGKPVIGSDVSGCREAVIHGMTGLLVPPADPQALAEAIESVLNHGELATELGQGGLVSVRAAGGWARLAQQTAELYDEVITDVRSERHLLRLYRV